MNERGVSVRRLCERMELEPGVSYMSVSALQRIINYDTAMTVDDMHAIGDALGVQPWDLLNVDPGAAGELIDIMQRMDEDQRAQAVKLLRAIAS